MASSTASGTPLVRACRCGSAASAVAGAVAVNALLGAPLDQHALLDACLLAEETVAGRHLDNIAPSLLGGIVLIRCMQPMDLVRLPVPAELVVVLVRPEQQMRTKEARAVLPVTLPLETALHQAAQVGALVAALALGDYELLGRAIDDRIAEPARTGLLPGFAEAVSAGRAEFRQGSVEALPFGAATFRKACTVNTVYFWTSLGVWGRPSTTRPRPHGCRTRGTATPPATGRGTGTGAGRA